MRKAIAVALMMGLLAGVMVAPADAKKKKKPKPVAATLYFHGGQPIGEVEIPDIVNGLYRKMDTTEPTDPTPKSVALAAVGAAGNGTPNPVCAGSPLFPVWVGAAEGKVVGDIKFALDSVGVATTEIEVRVWGVVPGPTACTSQGTENYVEPAAQVKVAVPPGTGTIEGVLEDVDFEADGALLVQFTPLLEGVTASRVLYDSTASVSQLEFTCIPPKGAKSCV